MIDVTLDKIIWEHGKGIVTGNFWLLPVNGEMVLVINPLSKVIHTITC